MMERLCCFISPLAVCMGYFTSISVDPLFTKLMLSRQYTLGMALGGNANKPEPLLQIVSYCLAYIGLFFHLSRVDHVIPKVGLLMMPTLILFR